MTSKLSSRNPFRTPAATPNPTAASASSGPSPYGSALPSTVSSPPSYPDPNSDDDGTPEKSAHSIMLSMPSVSSLKRVKTTRPLHSLPRISPLNNDIKEFFRSIFVDGAERVVSYDGVSQYSRDGTGASACGLAALNFARIVFSMEQGGLQDTVLLQAVLARGCVEVRRLQVYCIPLSNHISISKGSHCYMRTVVRKPSSRSRRHMPRSLV